VEEKIPQITDWNKNDIIFGIKVGIKYKNYLTKMDLMQENDRKIMQKMQLINGI